MTVEAKRVGVLLRVAKATGSYPHTINGYQGDDAARGNCAWGLRRLPHGHPGHVGVRVDLKDRASASSISVSACRRNFPDNWRGVRLASFSRISHRSVVLPPDRLVAALAFCRAERAITNSANASGCSPTIRQSLAHHQPISRTGDVPHVHSRLSSSLVSVGIDPNENGLTHEAQSLPPDGKAYV